MSELPCATTLASRPHFERPKSLRSLSSCESCTSGSGEDSLNGSLTGNTIAMQRFAEGDTRMATWSGRETSTNVGHDTPDGAGAPLSMSAMISSPMTPELSGILNAAIKREDHYDGYTIALPKSDVEDDCSPQNCQSPNVHLDKQLIIRQAMSGNANPAAMGIVESLLNMNLLDDIELDGTCLSRCEKVYVPVGSQSDGSRVWCLYIQDGKLYLTNGGSAAGKLVPGISVTQSHRGEILKYETTTKPQHFNNSSQTLVVKEDEVDAAPIDLDHKIYPRGSYIQPQPVKYTLERKPSLFLFRSSEAYLALNFSDPENPELIEYTEQELIDALQEKNPSTPVQISPLINIKHDVKHADLNIALYFNGHMFRYYLYVSGQAITTKRVSLENIREDDWLEHCQFSYNTVTPSDSTDGGMLELDKGDDDIDEGDNVIEEDESSSKVDREETA